MAVGQGEVLPGLVTTAGQEPEVMFPGRQVDLSANKELGLTEVEAASDGGSVHIGWWDASSGSQVGSEWRSRQTRCQP